MPRTFTADRGDLALRLDQSLLRHLTDVPRISRTRVQRWIDEGLVTVNGRPASRASSGVAPGDTVSVGGDEVMAERARPRAEAQALDVLFEDDSLLALNKPPGVVVHPSYKHAAGTLFNGVLGYLGADPADPDAPRLLHRLDKDTSGVLLVSKSLAVHRVAQRAMTSGRTEKTYLAVVHGRPKPAEGAIALPLGVDPSDRRRVAVREDGSPSETRYRVLARGEGASLVECRLVTGRMHQIRVHLAASGWPIVGDQVYGRPGDGFGRQALHAWRLMLPHPVTGAPLSLSAPLPPDLSGLCDGLGLPRPST
ncbi:MAG: RluA family pseudouridine synthase [Vicinamibacterales bacterium]